MEYILLGLFNIAVLIFVYFKFIAAIRKKSDSSVKNIKKEIARTVNSFNEEFDRNFTLIDDRAVKLDKLINNADKYVNLLLHLDKKMDTGKVVKLASEIKTELEKLQKEQKTLRQNINKDRVHNSIKMSKKFDSFKLDKTDKKELEQKETKYNMGLPLTDSMPDEKYVPPIKNHLSQNLNEKPSDYPELNFDNEDVKVEIGGTNKSKIEKEHYNFNKDNIVNENDIEKNSGFAHKAYKKAFNQAENNQAINELLKQNIEKDTVEIKKNSEKELFYNKKSFNHELNKNLYKDEIYNSEYDYGNENTETKKENLQGTSDLQKEIFSLINQGKDVNEICSLLEISKGEAQLHYHIYRARRKVE